MLFFLGLGAALLKNLKIVFIAVVSFSSAVLFYLLWPCGLRNPNVPHSRFRKQQRLGPIGSITEVL
jgi:hypothetical protein